MFRNWGFLLGEIWTLIALAALLGLLIGWWIWGRIASALRGETDTLRLRADELENTYKREKANREGLEMDLKAEREKIGAFDGRMAELQAQNTSKLGAFQSQIGERDKKIMELERFSAETERRESALKVATGNSQSRIAELERSLAAASSNRAADATMQTELAVAKRESASASSDLAACRQLHRSKDAEIASLKAQLASSANAGSNAGATAPLGFASAAAMSEAPAAFKGAKTKAKTAAKPAAKAKAPAKAKAAAKPAAKAKASTTAKATTKGASTGKSTGAGTRPTRLNAARGGKADDLKQIKGIGPKLEKLCNKLGFYHFDQVAAWKKAEVEWVDQNLEGFSGRVSRDEWVKQAKVLAKGGQTAFSNKVKKGGVY